MRRLLAGLAIFATLAAFAVTTGTTAGAGERDGVDDVMVAVLRGAEEVPAVDTTASGFAFFFLDEDEEEIDYWIWGRDVTGVTEAHIHFGAYGLNGPPVVFLLNWNGGGIDPAAGLGTVTDSFFASGTINAGKIANIDVSNSFDDVVHAMQTSNAYVNVHTVANPGGEIRGQIG